MFKSTRVWRGLTLVFALIMAAGAWVARALPGAGATAAAPSVVINRVMSTNPSACFSVKGRYYDWIELVNLSDEAVALTGWKLSDTADQRGAFAFDDVTLPGRGSLIVYCDDAPEGLEDRYVFCGFRLDADGELLMLSDGRGATVQTLVVPAMGASDVYQRTGDGEYAVTAFETMVAQGAVDLCPPYDAAGVQISELMAGNRTLLADEDGDYPDWIELYNPGPTAVELGGCALSDDDVNQRKWVLPPMTLQSGEYRLVFASGKDRREGELHAGFKLSSAGETIRLYSPEGDVLSWVEYGPLEKEASLSRLPDGSFTTLIKPTPGFENTEQGARAALSVAGENGLGLYINEIMSSASGFDWLELHNAGAAEIDLAGMGLSDSTRRPRRWQFPQGASIPAGGYLTVALVGGEAGQSGGYVANFALSAGETACLSLPDGTLIDKVTLFEQYRDVSYGRAEGHGRFRYFTEATPGAANARTSYERKAAEVAFSESGGQHADGHLTLTLSGDADAPIYYTTDGTDPTPRSTVYSGPIELSAGAVVKAIAWRQDLIPSDLAVRSFLLNADHGLRIVSVSGKKSRLNGSNGMLNTGVKGAGSEVYVEVYEPDGTRLIGQKCLMKLAGHHSRTHMAQKAFSLRAKKLYGPGRFNAALFSNRDYDSYNSIVMRASGQDCFKTHMRDSVLTALAADTRVMYQETEVCVVYVNGEYWGVYNMRERVCQDSIAQFEGWDNPDDVEIAEGTGASSESYQQLLSWVKSHNLATDANIDALRKRMDIENYLDYVALEMYACNTDMNNMRCYRNAAEDGLWRWVLFDLDLSYSRRIDNVADWLHGDTVGSTTLQSNLLFKSLMKNAAMRDYFLTRMGQLLATTFSVDSVTARIEARYNILLPEMARECKRWDWSLETWRKYGAGMVAYARYRPAALIGYLKSNFKLSDAQTQAYFGQAMAVNG